ncbi:MAG: GAF domain-containing protein [Actinobacteria bacterium]|nr:GAF domain-containing protein [Actinomycetota bacterium]MDI6830476.1 GAF domain-containing protein [Actinomycetota bacterium]
MDLRKRLIFFTRLIRLLAFVYLVVQYLVVRERYQAAQMIPVVVGLGVFYIIMDRVIFRVPEQRFRLAALSLMLFEMFLVSLLLYFTRSNPVREFEYLYVLPVANAALWFGLRAGIAYAGAATAAFSLTMWASGRIDWTSSLGGILGTGVFYFAASYIMGFMADFAERESEEKARRMVELTAVSGFATLFDSTLLEDKVYSNLCNAISRSVNSDVAMVFRLEKDGERLVVASCDGVSESEAGLEVPLGYGIIGRVLEEREPLLLKDTDMEREFRQLLETRRIRSAVYSPLKWRDEIYGVALAGNQERDSLDDNDLNLISALSVQAALAVHNSRLYSDLEDRIGELHAIFEIDKAITSAIDLETVLQQIVQMSVGLMDAKISSIMLLDEESEELVIAAAQGLSESYIRKGPIKVGESIAGRVILEGRPIAVYDIRQDPRHAYAEQARMEGLCSLLSVPLNLKDRVIGVLNIYTDEPHAFTPHEINLFTSLASQAAIAIENARLFESLEEIYIEVITAMASAIDARDAYTHGHSQRVTEYAVAIAEEMGLSPAEVDIIRNASILHDVGKIGIKEEILKKPGRLSEEERREMEYHPFIGTKILHSVRLLEPVMPLVYHHHERYDGTGYPDGLRGEEIPLGARIISVADAFESMTSDRPYRKAMPVEEAMAELRYNAGRQFDPRVVEVFSRLAEEGKIELEWSQTRVIALTDRLGRAGM